MKTTRLKRTSTITTAKPDVKKPRTTVKTSESEQNADSKFFEGKCFFIFGTFQDHKHQDLESIIIRAGGTRATKLTQKVNYAILADYNNDKADQAKLLGIPVLSVQFLLQCDRQKKLLDYTEYVLTRSSGSSSTTTTTMKTTNNSEGETIESLKNQLEYLRSRLASLGIDEDEVQANEQLVWSSIISDDEQGHSDEDNELLRDLQTQIMNKIKNAEKRSKIRLIVEELAKGLNNEAALRNYYYKALHTKALASSPSTPLSPEIITAFQMSDEGKALDFAFGFMLKWLRKKSELRKKHSEAWLEHVYSPLIDTGAENLGFVVERQSALAETQTQRKLLKLPDATVLAKFVRSSTPKPQLWDIPVLVAELKTYFAKDAEKAQDAIKLAKVAKDIIDYWGTRLKLEAIQYTKLFNVFTVRIDGPELYLHALARRGNKYYNVLIEYINLEQENDLKDLICTMHAIYMHQREVMSTLQELHRTGRVRPAQPKVPSAGTPGKENRKRDKRSTSSLRSGDKSGGPTRVRTFFHCHDHYFLKVMREDKAQHEFAIYQKLHGLEHVNPPLRLEPWTGEVPTNYDHEDKHALSALVFARLDEHPFITSLPKARCFMKNLLEALRSIHDRGIIHMDVKPANIMADATTGKLKLIDYELSYDVGTDDADATVENPGYLVGTEGFYAPEIINEEPFTRKCDIWSAGVVFLHLLYNFDRRFMFLAFEHHYTPEQLVANVQYELTTTTTRTPSSAEELLQLHADDLLLRLLSLNPAKRPTAAEALTHPFFK